MGVQPDPGSPLLCSMCFSLFYIRAVEENTGAYPSGGPLASRLVRSDGSGRHERIALYLVVSHPLASFAVAGVT